jgi:2-iminoacetate synthase
MGNGKLELIRSILTASDYSIKKFLEIAKAITDDVFGTKRDLINPLYISNYCINNCPYCEYRKQNNIPRRKLNEKEIINEFDFLTNRGTTRILVLGGELELKSYCSVLCHYLSIIYQNRKPQWIGVEAALLESDYIKLKKMGINCVSVFQETYNKQIYSQLHKYTPKADFTFRYNSQIRALNAGIGEVGLGILLGLNNWIEDSLSMAKHAIEIKKSFPNCKIIFSFPRLIVFKGMSQNIIKETINEEHLLRMILAFRIAFPSESLVLTGRESAEFLFKAASIVNILGKGGSTSVGGYCSSISGFDNQQFHLNQDMSFNDFQSNLFKNGFYS